MGWETFVQAGVTAYQAVSKTSAARKEAKAVTEEGRLLAENKARDTVREAGRLQSSFLSSGLTMEGTPMEVLKRSYQYGLEDINQIAKNANARSKNIMTKARTQMLEGFTSMVNGIDFGGGNALDDLTSGSSAFGSGVFAEVNGGSFGGGFNAFYDLKDTIANPANKGIF